MPEGVLAPSPVPASAPMPGTDDIEYMFCRWLAGPALQDVPPAAETLIMGELARLEATPGAAADLVPRVPAVIPQLLRSLRDDSASAADLARQVAQDVVLVAEVIREANSPYYRPTAPVRTIEGAIMLLGQNGMRMLLARVAFRPVISAQSGRLARLVAPNVWRHAETCALAASLLAPQVNADPLEAYLAGLLQDVGLIVAFRVIDQVCQADALPQSETFCAQLMAAARVLSVRIGAHWEFPATATSAVALAGRGDATPLARALAQGDQLAKLRLLLDAGQLAEDVPPLATLDAGARRCFEKLRVEQA
ncbi:HDOD domain-containing protein [Massilia horti]|uniref:HDOD domain-containing protein n=2 Tax=Massilia horti TaxID=2562153 RepID=A0A4Y9SYS4_9BURK|nr:HDOD domain-containing protein [Massilia horti]